MQRTLAPARRYRAGFTRRFRWVARSVGAVFVVAYLAHASPPELPTPTPTSLAAPMPKPSATPKPAIQHLAPDGVLFLLEDTIVPLKHGLQGIAAGTEVRLVKESGDTVEVAAEDFQFTMKKTQVTNDLDIVAAVRKRAAALENADEAGRQTQEAVLVKQQRDEIEFLRTHPLATPTPTPKK